MRSWLVGVLILTCAPVIHAQSGSEALLDRGVALYNNAKFRASIRVLEKARGATKDSKVLGRIELYLGLDHAVLGEKQAAEQSFAAALRHDPTIRLEPGAFKQDLVDLLESVRARQRGRVAVSADREGATLAIDGEPPVPLPFTGELQPGEHSLEVYRDGELVFSRKITVEPGKTMQLRVPIPAAGTARTDGSVRQDGPAPTPPGSAPVARKPRGRLWTWVTGGAGLAVLAVGLGLYLSAGPLAESNADDGRPCAKGEVRPACEALLDGIRTRENAGYALLGIGSALVVTSVVLFFVEGRSGSEGKRAVSIAPFLGPAAAGATLGGRF